MANSKPVRIAFMALHPRREKEPPARLKCGPDRPNRQELGVGRDKPYCACMDERKEKQEPSPKPAEKPAAKPAATKEIGGRKGPEPTRYGDWEVNGRCVDF